MIPRDRIVSSLIVLLPLLASPAFGQAGPGETVPDGDLVFGSAAPAPEAAPDLLPSPTTALYVQAPNPADTLGLYCEGEPCWYAVDFQVPAGESWLVQQVDLVAFFNSVNYAFDGFPLAIYPDDGTGKPAPLPVYALPAPTFTSSPIPGSSPWRTYSLTLPGPAWPELPPGTYWLAVDMVNEAAAFKRSFLWRRLRPPVNRPASFHADGIWTPLIDRDLAFALHGEVGLSVAIDILPGSAANPFNLKSGGTRPVALLSTESFDATSADPESCTLGDGDGDDTPIARRKDGSAMAEVTDVDGDGDADLVLSFEVQALVDRGDLTLDSTALELNGRWTRGSLRGADAIKVVPKAR